MAERDGFSLDESRYDQSTFIGRLRHFMQITDARTLLASKAELNDAVQLLESYRNHTLPEGVSVEDLWAAKKLRDATLHPDTGEVIPMPFRMAGFVPFGTITVVGMLLPATAVSMPLTIFWQWLNQTHNACVNYYNRNASSELDTSALTKAYLGATGVATSIAVGAQQAVKRAPFLSPSARAWGLRLVPFPSVSAASGSNAFLMRRSELDTGIEVCSVDGSVSYGRSRAAAALAVRDTVITRSILPAPVILIPVALMGVCEKVLPVVLRSPRLHLLCNTISCVIGFGIGLPVSISLFPQRTIVPVDALEEEFRGVKDTNGVPVTHLAFNKGL